MSCEEIPRSITEASQAFIIVGVSVSPGPEWETFSTRSFCRPQRWISDPEFVSRPVLQVFISSVHSALSICFDCWRSSLSHHESGSLRNAQGCGYPRSSFAGIATMFEPESCDQLCPLVFPGPGLSCPHGFCYWSPTRVQSEPEETQSGAYFVKGTLVVMNYVYNRRLTDFFLAHRHSIRLLPSRQFRIRTRP